MKAVGFSSDRSLSSRDAGSPQQNAESFLITTTL